MKNFKIYIITLITILAIDSVWLNFVANKLYKHEIGQLLASSPNLLSGIIFYFVYALALVYLVLIPYFKDKKTNRLYIGAGLLALSSYGTFDLTNQAVMKNWPTLITIIDMSWGVVLTLTSTAIIIFAVSRLNKN